MAVARVNGAVAGGRWLGVLLAVLTLGIAGCGRGERRPNVLWVVWDTVRADRMGLYEEHPADTSLVARAQATVLAKIDPADSHNSLRGGLRKSRARAWFVKAVGEMKL